MPALTPGLPAGYEGRPATSCDISSIHGLVQACELELHGRVYTDAGGIAADLNRPGLVPEKDTLLVHDGAGRLAARAWVNRRSEVDVHPRHRGRGLGAALLDWTVARAVRAGSEQIVQVVPDADAAAVALLRSRAYEPLVTQWLLEFGMPDAPAVPEPPPGVTVRSFRPEDARAAHQLVQDAFDEWQQRRQHFPEWAQHTVERPAFAPTPSTLALADGRLVGAVIALDIPDRGEGYIEQVAVHRGYRNRGIARVLLLSAFRAFHQLGRRACTLGTHSQTGALTPYLRVGMTVRDRSTVFRKKLQRDGD